MSFLKRCTVFAAALATLALTACAGGSATSPAGNSGTVQGVGMPSSVSVVTAKNAGSN